MNLSFEHRLFMFIMLALECEKMGLSMLGNVKHEFKMRLIEFLKASERLRKECDKIISTEDFEDVSENFSFIIEHLMEENRDEFIALVQAYFKGEVTIQP